MFKKNLYHLAALLLLSYSGGVLGQPPNSIKTMETNSKQDLENYRAFFDGLGNLYEPFAETQIEKVEISGVDCYWFRPPNAVPGRTMIYLHGGSFFMGSIQSHKAMVSHFAQTFKTKILFVEYSLTPEKPFPQGVDDLVKVYRSIAREDTSKIILMGDSAGGGILVSSMKNIQEEVLKQPDGAVLISPWLDLNCSNPSYGSNKTSDPILKKEELMKFAYYYAGSDIEKASPAAIRFNSFPPTLILTGSGEILLDDSRNFIDSIKTVQGNSRLSVYKSENHVWPLSDIHSEGSRQALSEIADFISGL